ncbi:MAG: hypothetical protein EOO42_00840 [Flavobacteriales bacterium]|nr:MAG: hypothetical protein EOO42_00840 [Flavobacteriales bacterium]
MRTNKAKLISGIPASILNARTALNNIAKTANHSAISDSIYKGALIAINDPSDPYHGQQEFEVRYVLRRLYYNKCAYCENISYKADVEHYRPKKKVANPKGNSSGYYWLCYEWSNLIPACFECNSRSGKWNKFPIFKNRLISPPLYVNGNLNFKKCKAATTPLIGEAPKLFHPEVDVIEPYIKVKWDGKLSGIGAHSERGNSTIKVCDLNRANLIYSRKKIIDDYVSELERIFVLFRKNLINETTLVVMLDERLTDIVDGSNITKAFSIVSFYIINNFQQFVTGCLSQLAQLEKQLLVVRFGVIMP